MSSKETLPYEFDASGIRGETNRVLFPKSVSELKSLVKSINHICIRGGGSGLVGSAVPQKGDTVLDLSKLNHIGSLNEERKTIEVESGVILDDLQEFLFEYHLEFPVNPSSHSICTIGGMIATNAVGNRGLKYGNTSKWIRWIEIIDSNGELKKIGATEISDFAGLEGITGIIARACLNLSIIKERTAELVEVEDYKMLLEKVSLFKKNREVTMIEFLDKFVSEGIGFQKKLHLVVEYENQKGNLKDMDYKNLMNQRDQIYPFLAGKGYTIIEDPKLMLNKIPELLEWLDKNKVPCFGHISVGILHPCFSTKQKNLIKEMMKVVKKLGGQISGEHGIGLSKKEYVDTQDKKIYTNIKNRKDRNRKFNSGKII